jgi:hypothetical protein
MLFIIFPDIGPINFILQLTYISFIRFKQSSDINISCAGGNCIMISETISNAYLIYVSFDFIDVFKSVGIMLDFN